MSVKPTSSRETVPSTDMSPVLQLYGRAAIDVIEEIFRNVLEYSEDCKLYFDSPTEGNEITFTIRGSEKLKQAEAIKMVALQHLTLKTNLLGQDCLGNWCFCLEKIKPSEAKCLK